MSFPSMVRAVPARRRPALALLVAALVSASEGCGADAGGPPLATVDEPAAEEPVVALLDLRVPATFGVRFVLALEGGRGDRPLVRVCPGSLTILRQDGARLAGTFQVSEAPGCSPSDAGSVEGTLMPFGDIRLELRVPGAGVNELPGTAGCTYADAAGPFGGEVNEKRLVAVSTAGVRCTFAAATDETLGLRVRISGERELAPPPTALRVRAPQP